jgi:hypothetical protein
MEVKPQFDEFVKSIRLTPSQVSDLKTGHSTLRDRLSKDETLSPIVVSTFLQGSYRRATAVKPKGDMRADVDVVVVTALDERKYAPQRAMELFVPFLKHWYPGKWKFHGRSIAIELSYVDLDLVVTSAPSEVTREIVLSKSVLNSESLEEVPNWRLTKSWGTQTEQAEPEWKSQPLRIPDREAERWEDTNPLEQIRVTRDKNKQTGGLYVNVVKAVKWWRRLNPEPKYPKGYPAEHMVYLNCPDSIASIAEGVTTALETMVATYSPYAAAGTKPFLGDHGVPANNVLVRVSPADFKAFIELATKAAKLARSALEATTIKESCDKWRQLFGDFPEPPSSGDGGEGGKGGPGRGGYVAPAAPATLRTERFA